MDPSESAANKAEQTGGEKYIPRTYDTNQLEKIPFPTSDGDEFVVVAEINYFEADGNYTHIHRLDKSKVFVVKRLGEVIKMVRSKTFYRIHDKYYVNGNQCHKYFRQDFLLLMENGEQLKVAEKRATGFLAFFIKNARRLFK